MSGFHDLAAWGLRSIDPETAHRLTIAGLKAGLGPHDRSRSDPILATRLADLDLPNPVGLAAGFDKNGEVPGAMLRAGFGFVECGTATPKPQPGNPRPRLFRLSGDRAVINRMGFNNDGIEAFLTNLARRPRPGIVGANIGANKDSADRVADYALGLEKVWGKVDYVTINVSSPNTPGLRTLQTRDALEELLGALAETRRGLPLRGAAPILLKVAPDLDDAEVSDIVEAAVRFGLQGLIISNTTVSRPKTLVSAHRGEAGGLSGAPLMERSTALLRLFHQAAFGRLALVGVGGIASGADAYAKVRAGASAVQLYSALVFEGPSLATRIRPDLAGRLRADGFKSLFEAVGVS